ncbi:hypothetical protein MS6_A0395 [Vibrio cholerae MS6]|nr:hypothetical protein MS6_A0395 [Vibrio cholerae MS6]
MVSVVEVEFGVNALPGALGIWRHHESYLFDSLRCFIEWLLGHARISKTGVGF